MRHLIRTGLRQQNCLRLLSKTRQFASESGSTEVCAIDPRFVLIPDDLAKFEQSALPGRQKAIVRFNVPTSLIPSLSKGRNELGESDDPHNSWIFGEKGEIFEYKFIGRHVVLSGLTSLITSKKLEELKKKGKDATMSWGAFSRLHVEGISEWPHPELPFLFAGMIVQADLAGVYGKFNNGTMSGLMVNSDDADLDA